MLVAVTIGIYVAGVVGGFIAIPIAGSVKVFIEEYLRSRDKTPSKDDGHARLVVTKKAKNS